MLEHLQQSESTNPVCQRLAAIVADNLQDLLRLVEEARVEDRLSKLDMTEMTRAFGHIFGTRLALELAVDGAEAGIVQAELAWLCLLGVHRLRILDMRDAHRLDLLRRQESELDLLDRLDRRIRVGKVEVRHLEKRIRIMYRKESRVG